MSLFELVDDSFAGGSKRQRFESIAKIDRRLSFEQGRMPIAIAR